MQMQAKMKTVEEQHADFQKHIAVLKESLIAKEEHYNMLQIDVSFPTNNFIFLLKKRKMRNSGGRGCKTFFINAPFAKREDWIMRKATKVSFS